MPKSESQAKAVSIQTNSSNPHGDRTTGTTVRAFELVGGWPKVEGGN